MTESKLRTRIAELQKALDQVQANGNALVGAIQECELWLQNICEESTTAVTVDDETKVRSVK